MNYYINYPRWITPYVIPGFEYIRWYSLMYLVAFVVVCILFRKSLKKKLGRLELNIKKGEDSDMLLIIFFSMIVGGRLGSALLYSGSYYWKRPYLIFWPFKGGEFVGLPGMSYHGGVVGVLLSIFIYSKIKKKNFLDICDQLSCCIPFAYTFGRLGNFFNAELYGKVASSGFGMIFDDYGAYLPLSLGWTEKLMNKFSIDSLNNYVNLPRHVSQLYEAFFEGIVLGIILWCYVLPRLKKFNPGFASGLYLILYGFFRFCIEYFRQPDEDLGYIIKLGKGSDNIYLFTSLLNISMGQILCVLMIFAGLLFMYFGKKAKK